MKSRILFVITFFSCLMLHGQTIHWIVFADTRDAQNGGEVESSLALLNTKFIDRVDDAMQAKGYFSKRHNYTGTRFTEQNCNYLLSSLACEAKDIVIFYYLGHGARAQVEREQFKSYAQSHPWPDLSFSNGNVQREYLSLSSVHNSLKKKRPRLVVTIGMCCNEEKSIHRRHRESSMGVQSKRYKIVSRNFAKRIQRWLLSKRGDVLVSASSPGELANGGSEYDSSDVDCFTGAWCATMDGYASSEKDADITWNEFMQKVSARCRANAKEMGERQNVQYVTNFN